ncbi:MAG: hypothetical protein LBP54_03155 [Campylobacteraceae bacterium]|nr:hypothetical protein [Campylobacteraceae bacterium]
MPFMHSGGFTILKYVISCVMRGKIKTAAPMSLLKNRMIETRQTQM